MSAPMLQKSKVVMALGQYFEKRALQSLFASQVRFKMRNTSKKLKEAHVSTKENTKYKPTLKKSKIKESVVIEEKVQFIADKPVDDVWISKYYPEPKYSLGEIIKRHKEYADPAMFNSLEARIYADMDISMKTKKQTKFLPRVKGTIELPHRFNTGIKQNVVVLCKEKHEVELALKLGAARAGGAELIKLIKDGVLKKSDFDHIVATPDMFQDVMTLRGPLREDTPDPKKGTISADIEKMLDLYIHGLTYETFYENHPLAQLQIPFGTLNMPEEWLTENFEKFIDSLNNNKPAGAPGEFIRRLTIIAPPSPERFILQVEDYSQNRHKLKEAKINDNLEEDESDDNEEGEVKKKAKSS